MSASSSSRAGAPASLSRELGLPESIVELGMTHPALRRTLAVAGGTLSLVASLDDDCITALDVEIGLGHRGFDFEVEARPWSAALTYVGRLGWHGGVVAEVAFCRAFEALTGRSVPERAQWMRVLAMELARVTEHFGRSVALASAIELPAARAAADRGLALGARLQAAFQPTGPFAALLCPGGVQHGPTPQFEAACAGLLGPLTAAQRELDRLGPGHPAVARRLRGLGPMAASHCAHWNVTGPAARAAGIRRDRRLLGEDAIYAQLDFEVPVDRDGDALARFRVVVEEIRQSLLLVEACRARLLALGPGPLASPTALEAPVSPGTAEATVESPTGELTFHLESDGGPCPRRVRCRAPSFFHAQLLPVLAEGASIHDLLAIVASMHIVGPECDR